MADISKITKGGVTYNIKDEYARDHSGGGTAATTTYDNTKTGLSATNVQDAIDEMADTNLYETVVLTIGSADSAFNPVGQTITVTLEDGSSTQYTVPISRQITFSVQRGMRYNISGTSTDDYRVLPISVKAAIPTRYLTMRYIPIATGVFILQKDGNYYLREEYDAETMAEDAVGVLVLTSALINAGFGLILGKNDNYASGGRMSYSDWSSLNSKTALRGLQNTELLLPTNVTAITNTYAKKIATDFGDLQGYMPAFAEAQILQNNQVEINNCLRLLSGILLDIAGSYVTSTYYSGGYLAFCWYYANGGGARADKNTYKYRPVYQFPVS